MGVDLVLSAHSPYVLIFLCGIGISLVLAFSIQRHFLGHVDWLVTVFTTITVVPFIIILVGLGRIFSPCGSPPLQDLGLDWEDVTVDLFKLAMIISRH